jgi:hypothetical protein
VLWAFLDLVLGLAEVVLVPLTLLWLVAEAIALRPLRLRKAAVLTAVTAATVAQPFGVRAVAAPPAPRSAAAGDVEAVHVARVAGLPLFGFRLYSRNIIYPAENVAPASLKARSWLWPGLLLSGARIRDVCGDIRDPCWDTSGERRGSVAPSAVRLRRADGSWLLHLRPARGETDPLRRSFGQPTDYRLSVGVTSWVGVVYWYAAGSLGAVLWLRRRRRLAADEGAGEVAGIERA